MAKKLGTPATKPTGKFPLTSAAAVTKLAATVENLGAAAYLGQAPNIQSQEILAAALSIHTVEARQAATLNSLLKHVPDPERRVRLAGVDEHRAGGRQAVHRVIPDHREESER